MTTFQNNLVTCTCADMGKNNIVCLLFLAAGDKKSILKLYYSILRVDFSVKWVWLSLDFDAAVEISENIPPKTQTLTWPQCPSSCAAGSSAVPACRRSPSMSQYPRQWDNSYPHWDPPVGKHLVSLICANNLQPCCCPASSVGRAWDA